MNTAQNSTMIDAAFLPRLFDARATADVLRVSVHTLARWRATKSHGLKWVRAGRKYLYSERAILDFLATEAPEQAHAA